MKTVTIEQAKTNLSQLIAEVEAGVDVTIMRGSEAAVRLIPANVPAPRRVFGALAGKVFVTPAFFEPLPSEQREGWEACS